MNGFGYKIIREIERECTHAMAPVLADHVAAKLTELAEALRKMLVLVGRAGVWVHQGCDCEFGSRGDRTQGKTCSVEDDVAQANAALKS